ncbi:hypothetical protein [Prevotella pallens]|uniref:hypothetical protein n=1 Tax=Prevotella pallens TaxID=60133 RepID=UPI001CB1F1B7|nr:hypothetical protein [Prevotella pallens]MBF1451913.1 hypothetical protein [Prevotella pallens]MBF1479016.1 hypothetical protein [Prevotella pallens]
MYSERIANAWRTPRNGLQNIPQYTHVHPRNWLRTDCGCAANELPNIADGLPKRCKTRCIIRHSAQQCTNIQT